MPSTAVKVSKRLVSPRALSTTSAPGAEGITVTVDDPPWAAGTPYQVCLAGTGAEALLDGDNHPLAGVVGEAVPAGAGRDACLFATYTPPTA